MESAGGAIKYPPPPGRDPLASVVAWVMLGVAAFAVLTLIARAEGSAGAGGHFSTTTDFTVALCAAVVVCTAFAFLRGKRWAALASVGEYGLGSIACFVDAGVTAHRPPEPPITDGGSYAVLSALVIGLGLLAAAAMLALPSTRRRFNGPSAGWYTDPAIETRLRWWNGQQWTTFTVS